MVYQLMAQMMIFVTCAITDISKNNKIKIAEKTFFPHSLGIFYHGMTQFIGFKKYGEEV